MDKAVLYDNKNACRFDILKDKTFVIGRSEDVDFRLSSMEVSRKQCQITYNGEQWTITNLSKHSLTTVNSQPVQTGHILKSKDIISISNSNAFELTFYEHSEQAPFNALSQEEINKNYVRVLFENQVLASEVINSRKRIRDLSGDRDNKNREVSRLRQENENDKLVIKELKSTIADQAVELETAMNEYNLVLREKQNVEAIARSSLLQTIEIDILKTDLSQALNRAKTRQAEANKYKQLLEKGAKDLDDDPILRTLEQEFSCCVCNEVVYKSVGLGCGHTLCKYCLQRWKQQKKECPMCRMPLRAEVPGLSLDSFIETVAPFLGPTFSSRREEIKLEREAAKQRSPATARGRGRRGGRRASNVINPAAIDLTSSPQVIVIPSRGSRRGRR